MLRREFFPGGESGTIPSMKTPSRTFRRLGLLVLVCCLVLTFSPASAPRSPAVQRVFDALGQLRQAAALPRPSNPRSLTVSEDDLNAYISYRILSEKEGSLRQLRLKAMPRNRIEGMMFLDLTKMGAPAFLKPNLHFYFSGRVVSQGGQIKLEVQELFLEYQPVPIFLLDLAFYIASKTQKHGPAGLADWYKLPLGIRDIVAEEGRFIISY
jgi:hypothetical protein